MNISGIPKIAAVTMVKNECDIIELFIRINSRVFDEIYVFDHRSDDATPLIINNLMAEGLRVKYQLLPDMPFEQSEVMTSLVRQIAALDKYDFICPIDADEFLIEEDILSKSSFGLSKFQVGLMPWRTYCPISDCYLNTDAPLFNIFRPREFEPRQYFKAIIGNEFAKNCSVEFGNHNAHNSNISHSTVLMPFHLNHVPVRTSEQLIRKVILGSYAFQLNPNRKPGYGYHWDDLTKVVRSRNYKLDLNALSFLAMNYASTAGDPLCKKVANDLSGLGKSTDVIVYKNECEVNLVCSMDVFVSNFFNK